MRPLLLSPRVTPDGDSLAAAARAQGRLVAQASTWHVPAELVGADVAVYASSMFVDVVAADLGVELLRPADGWLAGLDRRWTGRSIAVMTLGDARGWRRWPAFAKPADEKLFAARVLTGAGELPAVGDYGEDELVLVSTPVRFDVEARFFVAGGTPTASSTYLPERGPAPAEATAFVRELCAADTGLPAGVVVDVGRLDDGSWAVVEANPAWCSGLYDCDAAGALVAVDASCRRR